VRRGLAILAALALAGCASTEVRDAAPGERPDLATDEGGLWYQMEQAERQLQRSPLVVRDPQLNDYVRGVACRLAGDYCDDIRVYIVDVPAFNASMAPNGMMLVYTGLLLRADDEAQLAFVLGHEIAHYRERHMIERWRQMKQTQGFLTAFQVLTLGAGVGIAGSIAQLAGYSQVMAFSRDQEREADLQGLATLAAAGYTPAAAADLWQAVLAEEEANPAGRTSAIFRTHPATRERVADLAAAAAAADGPEGTRGREAYRASVAPHLARWLDAELGRRNDAQSRVLLARLHAAMPDSGAVAAARAALAARTGDEAGAAAFYAEAVGRADVRAETLRDYGLLLRRRGDTAGARRMLERYLAAAPDAGDRRMIEHYLEQDR
jgi:predicted Zn-dependent protease